MPEPGDGLRLVLLGPPGAGKGTQALTIAAAFDVPHISTGDIFRSNIRDRTPLGEEAQRFYDRGELVPDDLVNRMVADRLGQPDAATGFLLDGYPRTAGQADALEAVLAARGQALDGVLHFALADEVLERRIARRKQLEGRADDDATTFVRRLAEYRRQTADLVGHYERVGLLFEIDAAGEVDEVAERALTVARKLQR